MLEPFERDSQKSTGFICLEIANNCASASAFVASALALFAPISIEVVFLEFSSKMSANASLFKVSFPVSGSTENKSLKFIFSKLSRFFKTSFAVSLTVLRFSCHSLVPFAQFSIFSSAVL